MKPTLQIAAGVLIACGVIVSIHELWAIQKWRHAAKTAAINSHEESMRFAEKTGLSAPSVEVYYRVELAKPNKYSWFSK